jgi:hypothetical protein
VRLALNVAQLVKLNNAYKILSGTVKGREDMGDIDVEERIMLDYILLDE